MNNIEKELLKAISRQVTDNVPKLYIQDVVSGRVFEYGKNCHDRLVISEDGRCIYYSNMQDSDGSKVGDYRFYYEKPKFETEAEMRNAYDIDEGARTIEHQSISELLAEERKKVVQEIWKEFEQRLMGKTKDMPVMKVCNMINSVLDKFERGE